MVTTLKMSIEIWPTEYYSEIFNFYLCHLYQSMISLRLDSFFLEILIRKSNNFLHFLPCCVSMIIEIIFNQAIWIIPVRIFLSLQSWNQAIEFTYNFQKSLISIASILKYLLDVDTIIKTDIDDCFSRL